ncbi:MAG: hypothetical protein JW904_11420 [Spirochaetales bacterium]|nr:hypothetical protein [Spirochaetales bacterium]
MKIGIILYSGTGNTRLVAVKLEEALVKKGHKVKIDDIRVEGKVEPGTDSFTITGRPDVAKYDGIVFASPVMAFSLNPVMKKYLAGVSSLEGKRIALLITKHLSIGISGTVQAFGKMKKICAVKKGRIAGRAKVIWSSKKRAQMIHDAVETIAGLF